MSYFEETKNKTGMIQILLGIIISLVLLNLVAFKMVANIAENKTVNITIPEYMEKGDYIIGSNKSTKNVYKMWGRVWFKQISDFSYKNIKKRLEFIEPFLDRKTRFQSKSELDQLVKSVEKNFITQTFEIKEYSVEELKKGFVKIEAKGTLFRKIGLKQDALSGIPFGYSIIAYTRHGQVFIKSLSSFVDKTNDSKTRQILKSNKYINFEKFLSEEDKKEAERQKEKKKAIQASGGMG